MAGICSNFIPSLNRTNVNRFIVGAGTLAAYWYKGPVTAAITMLAGCAYSYYLNRGAASLRERVMPVVAAPILAEEHKGEVPARALDLSVRLYQPVGQAAGIQNEGNSCAFSSVLWNLANMTEILGELPEAIGRRLAQIDSLPGELNLILQKRTPITLDDFHILRIALEHQEYSGRLSKNCTELLSLLQLHHLVREFQTTGAMPGDRVNDLRAIIHRIDPQFEAIGTRMGDAHEIFSPLAELIFRGSRFDQHFHFTNAAGNDSHVANWGHLELPLMPQISVADTLLEYLNGCNGRFDTAPPILAINLKRNDLTYVAAKDQWVPAVTMRFDPVIPNDVVRLGGGYFRDNKGAEYQLIGVCRRMEDMAHYDAIWKRPEGQWYYGNDLEENPVRPAKPPSDPTGMASEVSAQGYLFFYRKVS